VLVNGPHHSQHEADVRAEQLGLERGKQEEGDVRRGDNVLKLFSSLLTSRQTKLACFQEKFSGLSNIESKARVKPQEWDTVRCSTQVGCGFDHK